MANNKSKNKNKDEYNFDVLKNYTCNGQYTMVINGTNISIEEEKPSKKDTVTLKQ